VIVHLQRRPAVRGARATVSLANRVQIRAASTSANADALEMTLKALDHARFEAPNPAARR
jgi:hypothetical protein